MRTGDYSGRHADSATDSFFWLWTRFGVLSAAVDKTFKFAPELTLRVFSGHALAPKAKGRHANRLAWDWDVPAPRSKFFWQCSEVSSRWPKAFLSVAKVKSDPSKCFVQGSGPRGGHSKSFSESSEVSARVSKWSALSSEVSGEGFEVVF